jgi:uncharacterized membrane-anchored protein
MTTRPASGEAARGATVIASLTNGSPWTRHLQNKVPQSTPGFWATTLLATTLGATAADSLSEDLELGLGATTAIMGLSLVGTLLWQLSTGRLHPGSYWLSVVLCSATGALLADSLGEELGLGLPVAAALTVVALVAAFIGWHLIEHTISVHSVFTRRREVCSWVVVVCACAMGSSVQDLTSRSLGLGHAATVLLFAAILLLVVAVAVAGHRVPVPVAFWAAYVVIRPLGAAIGDLLTARSYDGLGLRPDLTSVSLMVVVLGVVGVSVANRRWSGDGQVGGPTFGP